MHGFDGKVVRGGFFELLLGGTSKNEVKISWKLSEFCQKCNLLYGFFNGKEVIPNKDTPKIKKASERSKKNTPTERYR